MADEQKTNQDGKVYNNSADHDSVVKSLYEKNIEIVDKNKTLSLLSKLYEISILTLEPSELAKRITQTILIDLSFEFVGILHFESEDDSLYPLGYAETERVRLSQEKLSLSFEKIKITDISSREFFRQAIYSKTENIAYDLKEIWGGLIDSKVLETLTAESHTKTILLYPLIVQSKVLGVIVLALNRDYEKLNAFEKECIKSFINVVAIALEKAYLYKDLETANSNLRELDRQKDELLSIVSHQLATPVASLRWYTEMMMDGDLGKVNDEQKEHLNSMMRVAINLSDLVSMILDVSRIQLGKMRIEKQELNLDEFFKEILEIIEPKAIEKKVKFDVSLPESLPKANLDKRYTHMTVENLLSNAVKYTPEGGVVKFKIEIKNNIMYCEVTDTGCGIPKQDQDKIFGKLFRASNVRNSVDGNGFGLFVAKGAVESQGGKIWFESEENKGTTFFIELPLK